MAWPNATIAWIGGYFAHLDAVGWSAFAETGTLVVAVAAAIFAFVQLRDARQTRREQSAPYVIALLEYSQASEAAIDLVIKNIGQTPAFNITMQVSPEMERATPIAGFPFMGAKPIAEGIKMLAPGEEVRMHFDHMPDRRRKKLSSQFQVSVNARDSRNRKLRTGGFDLDALWGETSLRTDVHKLHWIGTRVKEIETSIGSIAQTLAAAFPREPRFADPAKLAAFLDGAIEPPLADGATGPAAD